MAARENAKLSDVFGVSRDIPLTYVTRKNVDELFVQSLTRDKHVVVFGGSKQGKTCLRKHTLRPEDYIVIQCSNTMKQSQLYSSILKEAGVSIDVSEKRTLKGENKIKINLGISSFIPLLGSLKASSGAEASSANESTTETKEIEIDPGDPNDIIRILNAIKFDRYIVLEDFHYLAEEIQRQIAMDLKAFHEKSKLCFIIVGVWLESNRLVMYNGDLAGRLIPIDVDQWLEEDLDKIFDHGESFLNIKFSQNVRKSLMESVQGSVGILQEACYRLCEEMGINFTSKDTIEINAPERVNEIISAYSKEQAGRYQNFLSKFIEGFVKSELEMYKWIAYILIQAPTLDLKHGIAARDIFSRMQLVHPYRERLLANNVVQALRKVSKLQNETNIRPTILDFDSSENELKIVDSGFILYLNSQDKQQLCESIGLDKIPDPIEVVDVEMDPAEIGDLASQNPEIGQQGLFPEE